jgi:hypothetical protein
VRFKFLIVASNKSAILIPEPTSKNPVDNVEVVVKRFEAISPESQATGKGKDYI